MTQAREGRNLALAVALIAVPVPLAFVFLIIGLFGPLIWVYLSIAVSVLWVPCIVTGVVILARRGQPKRPVM